MDGFIICESVTPPSAEVCDGLDNDCDGAPDEDLGQTTCGVGACEVTEDNCVAGAPQTCTAGAPAADDATCDGIDDDCDGVADENFPVTPTACGVGACVSAGQNQCVGGAQVNDCTAGTPAADDATCDSIDDDCDGLVDEGTNPSEADSDLDGIANTCDACPNDPENDVDGDGLCGDEDPCKFFTNTLPLVISGISGIPDECLCGDFDGNGSHSATDASAINQCASFTRSDCVSERDEVDGNIDGFYSATDASLVNRVASFMNPAYTLTCGRRPEGTCGEQTGVSCDF